MTWYLLVEFTWLKKKESILIHFTFEEMKQLTIHITQYLNAEIYVIIDFEEKKKVIMNIYNILEDHIFYSKNVTFVQDIMCMMNECNVNVTLNSLSDELLVATWECMMLYDCFVEIDKKNIDSYVKLLMFLFKKNISFDIINAAAMFMKWLSLFHKSLVAVMNLRKKKKLYAAKLLHVYFVSKMKQMFQYMQREKNIEKIIVKMRKMNLVIINVHIFFKTNFM